MTKTKLTKVLALYDSHYPFTINLKPFIQFASMYQPDIFLLGGDNWSLDCISHWNDADFKNVGFDNVQIQLQSEARGLQVQLDMFRTAMPHAKFVYILGNHEEWVKQFVAKYPQMNALTVESLLQLSKRRIQVIPFGKTYRIGELYFKHGHEFGTENPAKQAVIRSHHSIVIGHHHTFKVWADYSDVVDTERHVGMLVPCYCNRAPDYGRGRPNAWLNGFFYASVKPSGKFSAGVQLVAPNGTFIAQDGRMFEGEGSNTHARKKV
mgnify:CR=1 FL=1